MTRRSHHSLKIGEYITANKKMTVTVMARKAISVLTSSISVPPAIDFSAFLDGGKIHPCKDTWYPQADKDRF